MAGMRDETALILRASRERVALRQAVALWAEATTDASSPRRADLLRDKQKIVADFFVAAGKSPAEVSPLDVKAWREALEQRRPKLALTTVYHHLSRLASFYNWALKHTALGQILNFNPVPLARPKAPKKYQTASAKAWTDEQVIKLVEYLRAQAREAQAVIAKRDYALLLCYLLTGLRRAEVIGWRGRDLEWRDDVLIVKSRVKGGAYLEREVSDPAVRAALLDYLEASQRLSVLGSGAPIWIRLDRASKAALPLTSHGFVKNLKRYAQAAGLDHVHLHQTRHTYARLVAEHAGSLLEVQEALDHQNLNNTRVYVQRIVTKKDRHSRQIAARLKLHG